MTVDEQLKKQVLADLQVKLRDDINKAITHFYDMCGMAGVTSDAMVSAVMEDVIYSACWYVATCTHWAPETAAQFMCNKIAEIRKDQTLRDPVQPQPLQSSGPGVPAG